MRKKGSMQLGINAIVILIIALAILGLGMGFVTRLFGDSTSKFVKIIDNAELPFTADPSDQLKLEAPRMDLKMKKEAQLRLSVYNDGGTEANVILFLDPGSDTTVGAPGECLGTDDKLAYIKMVAPEQYINSGETGAFSTMLEYVSGSGDTPEVGQFICTVIADLDDGVDDTDNIVLSKSIYINVKR